MGASCGCYLTPPAITFVVHRFVNGALAAEFALISSSAEKLIKRKRDAWHGPISVKAP
jgi:hypothetical protein